MAKKYGVDRQRLIASGEGGLPRRVWRYGSVFQAGSTLLGEIGELFDGLELCSGSPADSPNQVHLQSNCYAAADHHNVKYLDLTYLSYHPAVVYLCLIGFLSPGG